MTPRAATVLLLVLAALGVGAAPGVAGSGDARGHLSLQVPGAAPAVAGSGDARGHLSLQVPGTGARVEGTAGAGAPVERVAGPDRVATAVAAARAGWATAQAVVLASGRAAPDALAGGALAARLGAPLLLTEPDRLPAPVAEEVVRLGAREVLVLGGDRAVAPGVVAALAALPSAPVVRRVAGSERAATAAAAARLPAADPGGSVVLASGADFPDALVAANLGPVPVLLADADGLPAPTVAALTDLAPQTATVLGGTAAVGEAAEAALRGRVPAVERIGGPDRYATALRTLELALAASGPAPRPLVVATGAHFPDALAAGALAARLGGAVLLVPADRLPDDARALVAGARERVERAVVLGGTAAVGPEVEAGLRDVLAGEPDAGGSPGTVGPLPDDVRAAMTGVSWRPGCPVGLDDLALVEVDHHRFDGTVARGRLVVAATVAEDVLGVFTQLFVAAVPIERMEPVDAYGGDDDASMAANNTSGFNCRTVAGTDSWSEHAYGTAVDVNPVQNPFVTEDAVAPEAGRAYLDRADVRPGMAVRPGPLVAAFEGIGWGWGGDWQHSRDYQHFSASGR